MDGRFGPKTEASITAFQKSVNQQTGVALFPNGPAFQQLAQKLPFDKKKLSVIPGSIQLFIPEKTTHQIQMALDTANPTLPPKLAKEAKAFSQAIAKELGPCCGLQTYHVTNDGRFETHFNFLFVKWLRPTNISQTTTLNLSNLPPVASCHLGATAAER